MADHSAGGCETALLPLVFVHGAQQDGFCWAALAHRLARPGRIVLTPDLPGHGASTDTPLSGVEPLADWLLGLLDRHGMSRAALIGHSLGSLVALEAAARAPDRVARLALLGTAFPMPVAARLLEKAAAEPARAMAMVNRGSHSVRGWLASPSPVGLWAPGLNLRLMERQASALLALDLAACNAYAGGLAAAARVTCPVLAILGTEDRMTPPAAAQALLERFADLTTLVLPGTGHALMTEAPERVARALGQFLVS